MVDRLEDPAREEFQNPKFLIEIMHPPKGQGFLDFGIGTGYFALPLYERFGGTDPFYGVDIQPEMLELLKDRSIKRFGKEVITPVLATKFPLPIPAGSIGLMWMVNVYHELSERKQTLEEILRLLSPGGSLFIVDWNRTETPVGPPLEERVADVDLYDDLLTAGFDKIRSWDIYPWHMTVQVLK